MDHPTQRLPLGRANVLGVGVTATNLQEAAALLCDAALARAGGYVCVTGVHGVSEAQSQPDFRHILNAALMNCPDGMPMSWVGWAQGFDFMDRVYGPDLMLEISRRGLERGLRHFYYGGKEGVADLLAERMQARFPGLQVVGTYCPPFRPLTDAESDDVRSRIEAGDPHCVWIGLSTPKQERCAVDFQRRIGGRLFFGVGAAFDFHAGLVPQAPHWMQRAGLEWFFRLTKEPRRLWRRYLVNNPKFAWRIALQLLRLKRYDLES